MHPHCAHEPPPHGGAQAKSAAAQEVYTQARTWRQVVSPRFLSLSWPSAMKRARGARDWPVHARAGVAEEEAARGANAETSFAAGAREKECRRSRTLPPWIHPPDTHSLPCR